MTDGDSGARLKALDQELDDLYSEFYEKVERSPSYWHLQYGPIRLTTRINSQRITQAFITFCLTTLLIGAAFTFFSVVRELGIAMVVGSIFIGGSFLVQYWAIQVANEREIYMALHQERSREVIARLARRMNEVTEQIEEIDPDHLKH